MPVHAPLAPLCKPDARDTLLDRLCEVANSVPDAIAISCSSPDDVDGRDGTSNTVTFDELLHRTYALARKIAHLVPGDPRPIAVEAECTVESMTLMLAVMASGNSLVPFDTSLPEIRASQIMESASALRLTPADLTDAEDSAMPLPAFTGSRTALIAFTSGSTGIAKGVLLSHRMCLTKAYELSSALGLTTKDRVGNALPVSFGAGINTLFAGLLSGASVYCTDPRTIRSTALTEWIEQSSLTTLHCSPSLVRSFDIGTEPLHDNIIPSLRIVTTYGEALHSRDVTTFRSVLGSGASFVNWYATTEAGAVAYDEYRADQPLPDGFLSAGTLPRGKLVDVVDSSGKVLPAGEVGEIRVSAECLSDGYLGLHELTRSRFAAGGVLQRYTTGDLGRFDAGGRLHLLGRADDAIKVRGYLVEPAEVEQSLRALTGITDAVVVACEHNDLPELAAYFVGSATSESRIKASLRELLPEWMIPKFVVELYEIPRNERGKVVRSELPFPTAQQPGPSHAAVGATERWLSAVVSAELGTESIGRDDDFSRLGATSLTMINILVSIKSTIHIELSPSDLAEAMSVRTLARFVDESLSRYERMPASDGSHVLVRLDKSGALPGMFIVTGAGVPAVGLVPFARRLRVERAVYALQPRGLGRRALPDRTVGGAAVRYVREIKAVQPQGPYIVGGHSIGGWTALEVARLMSAAGDAVERVVLIDPLLTRELLDRFPGGSDLACAASLFARPTRVPVRDRIRDRLRIITAGVVRTPTTERWLIFALIASKALRRHRPEPWMGPTTVVVSDDNVVDPASWSAVLTGPTTLVHVHSSHNDLVREPSVAQVAQAIDNSLGTAPEETVH